MATLGSLALKLPRSRFYVDLPNYRSGNTSKDSTLIFFYIYNLFIFSNFEFLFNCSEPDPTHSSHYNERCHLKTEPWKRPQSPDFKYLIIPLPLSLIFNYNLVSNISLDISVHKFP